MLIKCPVDLFNTDVWKRLLHTVGSQRVLGLNTIIILQQQTQTTSLLYCLTVKHIIYLKYMLFYILFILSCELFHVNIDMSNNYFYMSLYHYL